MSFYTDLLQIIPKQCITIYDLDLNDPLLTEAINGMIANPKQYNPMYMIKYLIIFDTEFYTIKDTTTNLRKELGLITKLPDINTAHFVRQLSMLVLERQIDNSKQLSVWWKIKVSIDFDFQSGLLYAKLAGLRKMYPNLSVQMLGEQFLTVSNSFNNNLSWLLNKKQINMDKKGFINKLALINKDANNNNYLNYSYFANLNGDKDLIGYYDSVKIAYINDPVVKNRMLDDSASIAFLNLINSKQYRSNISFLYKGDGDLHAMNNSYKLFNDKFTGNDIDFVIEFKNTYDMVYFNGMSNVLFDSAKLEAQCDNIYDGTMITKLIEFRKNSPYSQVVANFANLVTSIKSSGKAHNPAYDTLCTFLTVLIINLALYIVFNIKNKNKSEELLKLYACIKPGDDTTSTHTGGNNSKDIFYAKYKKYKRKYLDLKTRN